MSFWERSGPHPKGGFTSLGVKRRVRFEKEITHPQGALTCTCTRSHMCVPESAHTCAHKMCVPESAHTCMCTYAPAGCMKSTHPKGATTEAKRGHEKHNRTLTPAHTCDRVKIVRAEIAPRMSAHARVYTCAPKVHMLYMHPLGACIRTEGAVYEPRSEAESAPRKRKKQTEP